MKLKNNRENRIYVVSGPSGVGKSTIIRNVMERVPDLTYSVSHTTRSPRGREANGVEYYFVGKDVFEDLIDKGAFVEWAKVYDDYYGTSVSSLQGQLGQDRDVILDIDSQGARNIKNHFSESVLVFLLPPSFEELEKRLVKRETDKKDVIKRRVQKALAEIGNCKWYDYIIFNEDLEKAVEEMVSIIKTQQCPDCNRIKKPDSGQIEKPGSGQIEKVAQIFNIKLKQ